MSHPVPVYSGRLGCSACCTPVSVGALATARWLDVGSRRWVYVCLVRWRSCDSDGKRNKFVERAVECAMQVFGKVVPDAGLTALLQGKARRGLELHLHLVADNDFYSQRGHVRALSIPWVAWRGMAVCEALGLSAALALTRVHATRCGVARFDSWSRAGCP